ncbi:hypothetical protein Pint_02883 [Pistacia integerrima]|uniref:Uncharacterized protein n=1 Tax=Pistacia integerrima TaxID=434235 RepID=A0ACC0ZIL6_9ROSI|nr:hypothetical protein Pint_02883 [Pistacia integerrima]
MVAHLSDFGIAKLLDEDKSVMQITQTLGTIGYMAPEYGREGKVSRKCDVYSYGILLMETFTRKRPTDEIFDGETCLRSWIGESLLDNSIIEVVDRDLVSREEMDFSSREECLLCILNLAMDCTADLPEKRIDMKNVVSRLVKIRVTLS